MDYSKFDEATKAALSVFDTDSKKGHLSQTELKAAVDFFASHDGFTENIKEKGNGSTTTGTRVHHKDGILDKKELLNAQNDYNNNPQYYTHCVRVDIQKRLSKFVTEYCNLTNEDKVPDEVLNQAERIIKNAYRNGVAMQLAINALDFAQKAETEGYKQVPDTAAYKKDGKYYLFFEVSRLKNGFRRLGEANKKGQKSATYYDNNGNIKALRALNNQNKAYTNEAFAAKQIGLMEISAGRTDGTNLYQWNDEKHQFDCKRKLNETEQSQFRSQHSSSINANIAFNSVDLLENKLQILILDYQSNKIRNIQESIGY